MTNFSRQQRETKRLFLSKIASKPAAFRKPDQFREYQAALRWLCPFLLGDGNVAGLE
jgi:hypothetical protein